MAANVQIGAWRLRLHLWPTLLACAGIALLSGLGTWQLQRGASKQALLARVAELRSAPVVALQTSTLSDAELHQRQVSARGQFDAGHTFLLDNRTRDGNAGYEVLVPLRLAGSGEAVLVNRGWIARGPLRADKPPIVQPAGDVAVRGMTVVPGRQYHLGTMLEPGSDWPHIVQYVAPGEMQALLGYGLRSLELRLAADDEHALRAGWPVVTMMPQRHYGYAVQWFGLALALAVIYLAAITRRD